MKGADIPDLVQDAAGLAQQQLDVGAILAHDVGEVPAGLVDPVPVEVHLVGKQLAVQGDEGPEASAEKRTPLVVSKVTMPPASEP